MSLFNFKSRKAKTTTNLADGKAYMQSPEMQLASLLVTSFAQDQYYRSSKQSFDDLTRLLRKVDPLFAAKAAIYARKEMGMRSITHVLAAEIAAYVSGKEWAKDFYQKIIHRPDDMLEIVAYYKAKGGKNMPNAMKKGFAKAFDQFDGYQLAKYRGNGKAVKLVDIVNLVHPIPTVKNRKALQNLVDNTLRNKSTWEAKLTKAGQATSDQEVAAQKTEAWSNLLAKGKLGYFALLRNLRNIADQAPSMLDSALDQLTDSNRIRKSMVLPFRYLTAYKQFSGKDATSRKIRMALDIAIELSCANVPILENTLVAIDNSGSMQSPVAKSQHLQCSEAGAIFGMIIAKKCNADIMEFGTIARYISYGLKDSVTAFGANFASKNKVGHGTNFNAIFNVANKRYDRIVVLSDMQGWIGGGAPTDAVKTYQNKYSAAPYIYSFDLRGYGSLQFPENKVFALAGFSDKIFDIMKLLEQDPKALINKINTIEL